MATYHKKSRLFSGKRATSKKRKLPAWAIWAIVIAAIVLCVGLKVAYNGYVSGTIDMAPHAVSEEMLNHIAANADKLAENTELFMNPYAVEPAGDAEADAPEGEEAADGEEAAEAPEAEPITMLYYIGSDSYDYAIVQFGNTGLTEYAAEGQFARTPLTSFIDGVAPWGQTAVSMYVANAACGIQVYDSDADGATGAPIDEIIAAIEGIIGQP